MTALLSAHWQTRAVRILQTLIWVGVGMYLLSVLPGVRARPGYEAALDAWLYCTITVAAAVLCALRAMLIRRDRAPWGFLAVGLALYALGNVCYYTLVQNLDPQPYPSGADLLWLGFYPLAYVGVVMLAVQATERLAVSVLLDGLVAGFGAAALGAAFVFGELLTLSGGSFSTVFTRLAYPVADLTLLIVVVVAMAMLGWRPGRAWWLLALGLVAFSGADSIFLLQVTSNTYEPGTLLGVLWLLALVLPAFAAWGPQGKPVPPLLHGRHMLIPAGFAFGALSVLVYGCLHRLSFAAVELATSALILAILRTVFSFREVRMLAQTHKLAHTDDLTGLGNRRHFYERLNTSVDARQGAMKLAVLIVDLDRFKEVNDSLGHHVGDQLLQLVALRLQQTLRAEDTLARLGGDEFAMLLCDSGSDRAADVGTRMRHALEQVFTLEGVALHISASVGIAICPDHATTPTGLIQQADIAMYAAKGGSGLELYRPERDSTNRDRLQMVEGLRTALAEGQLVLHFQPKVDLRLGTVAGVEALVRWQHPTKGLLYPDAFLPLAEHAGLMRPLTEYVLGLALEQCRRWRADGRELSVAVNISASNLLDVDFPAQVQRLLTRSGLPGHALVLELTESTLMAEHGAGMAMLRALHELGVQLSIDDYGTGYSSLAYLRELPVDELKLDKSFVISMARDPRAAEIVRSTVGLAHSLGLSIVAEGVETQEVLEQLAGYGCDLAQGYHFSRPTPAAAMEPWVTSQRTPVDPLAWLDSLDGATARFREQHLSPLPGI